MSEEKQFVYDNQELEIQCFAVVTLDGECDADGCDRYVHDDLQVYLKKEDAEKEAKFGMNRDSGSTVVIETYLYLTAEQLKEMFGVVLEAG